MLEWNSNILRYCPGWLSALWVMACIGWCVGCMFYPALATSYAYLVFMVKWFAANVGLTAFCAAWAWVVMILRGGQ